MRAIKSHQNSSNRGHIRTQRVILIKFMKVCRINSGIDTQIIPIDDNEIVTHKLESRSGYQKNGCLRHYEHSEPLYIN